jgi:hypothetical protein
MAMLRLVVMAVAEGAAVAVAMAVATVVVVVVVVVEVVMVDLHHMIVVLVVVVVVVVLVVVVVVVAFLNRSVWSKILISSLLFSPLSSVMEIRTGPNLRRHSTPRLPNSSKAWVAPCSPTSYYLSV